MVVNGKLGKYMTVNLALYVAPKLALKDIPELVSTKSHEI